MDYLTLTIDDIKDSLDNKKITSDELFNNAREKAHKYQDKYNCFVTIMDKKEEEQSSTILRGIPYALKDNYSTKGILTTASSNILKDYVPVYDSTVYKKLKEAGATLLGKTVLDELAMGGTGTTGHTGIVKNPWDSKRLIGGSSAGSAASVSLGIVPFAIGSDTGDSVRKPAGFGGIVGFKPTYGRISRYGLFAFASSLDHVGYFTRCVKDAAYLTDILKGRDEHDMTSLKDDDKVYAQSLNNDIRGRKLFYIREICDLDNYKDSNDLELKETIKKFHERVEDLKKIGFIIEGVNFSKNLLEAIYPTYMSISCAEATSNNANLTGILYGSRKSGKTIDELIFQTRTEGFSELIKRRFILGSYILQKENQEKLFLNACRVRRLIVDNINNLFNNYDGLIMPTSGSIAPLIEKSTEQLSDRYLPLENHLQIGNFGGFPSISLPSGFVNNLPISINITGPVGQDAVVLNMAYKIEEILGYKGLVKKDE